MLKHTEQEQKMMDYAELLDDSEIAAMLREMPDDDVIYPAEVIVNVDGLTNKEISLQDVLKAQVWCRANL